MARDHRKLRVFTHADALVLQVYRVTAGFPSSERYALQSQLRRAAISVSVNIVEGSARESQREYVNFLNIANGSCAESEYLLDLAQRLGLIPGNEATALIQAYKQVTKELQCLMMSLRT